MKQDYEVYVVVIGRREGKRYAERKPLNVPVALATGRYEELSDLQLREFTNDAIAERERRDTAEQQRADNQAALGDWDPWAALRRSMT